jgi:hypothetical protein
VSAKFKAPAKTVVAFGMQWPAKGVTSGGGVFERCQLVGSPFGERIGIFSGSARIRGDTFFEVSAKFKASAKTVVVFGMQWPAKGVTSCGGVFERC